MNTVNNKILLVCDDCKRVKLVNKADYDLKDAVFVLITCERCEDPASMGSTTRYYNEKGYMDYIDNEQVDGTKVK